MVFPAGAASYLNNTDANGQPGVALAYHQLNGKA